MDKEKISELKTEVHKYWHKNIKLEPKIILTEEQLMEIVGHFYEEVKMDMKQQMIAKISGKNLDKIFEKFRAKYKPKKIIETECYKRGILDVVKIIKEEYQN